MNAPTELNVTQPISGFDFQSELRIYRVRNALRAASSLSCMGNDSDMAAEVRRGDLADLLWILGDELEAAMTGKHPPL